MKAKEYTITIDLVDSYSGLKNKQGKRLGYTKTEIRKEIRRWLESNHLPVKQIEVYKK